MTKSDYLALHDLHIAYRGAAAAAVHGLNLAVPQGQLISLLGPSGCGKTTTMRAVAGLLAPQRGRIELAGEDITHVPAHRRDIGLVFQSYALFPHLSAHDNVAFGLVRGRSCVSLWAILPMLARLPGSRQRVTGFWRGVLHARHRYISGL